MRTLYVITKEIRKQTTNKEESFRRFFALTLNYHMFRIFSVIIWRIFLTQKETSVAFGKFGNYIVHFDMMSGVA